MTAFELDCSAIMYGTPIDVCVGVQILDKSELISIFFFYDAVFRISIQSRCDQNGFRQFRERVCNHRCSDSLFNNELSLSLSPARKSNFASTVCAFRTPREALENGHVSPKHVHAHEPHDITRAARAPGSRGRRRRVRLLRKQPDLSLWRP